MEKRPSSKTNSHSVSQETTRLMEPKFSLPCSQDPATSPCPEPDES